MSTDHQSPIEEQVEGVLMIERVTDPSCEHQFSSPIPCQVLSPLAKNLFHRTISENGVVLTPSLFGKNVRPLAEVSLIWMALVSFPMFSWNPQGSFLLWDSAEMLKESLLFRHLEVQHS
jgi:hypothetical protein